MFVNDTGRLPESGRVCVAGFQAEAAGPPRNFYSLEIHAARAEIEPMPEPRNPAHVLGVGCEIESTKGPVFAAYFAASRERYEAVPNYKNGLYVLVDGAVYAVKPEGISTSISRGFTTRRFTVLRQGRPQRTVEYRWPWYKEPFVSSGHVRSQDFLRELTSMLRNFG